MRRIASIRGRRRFVSAAVVGGVVLLCVPPPVSSDAESTDEDMIASASYANAEIWLRRKPDDLRRRELVFKATPDAAPRVLGVTVPPRNTSFTSAWSENLALGLDGAGELTVVVQSARGLYWTRVTGAPRLHRVPRTGKRDVFPSILRGRIAYAHAAGSRSSVRLGSLTRGLERTVWSNSSGDDVAAGDTAIGAGDAVAFVTVADGGEEGLYDAQLVRPGRRALVDLWPGDRHNGGLSLTVSRSGLRLTVAASRSRTTRRYALPSGRVTSRRAPGR